MTGRIRRGEMGGDRYTQIKNRLFRDSRISYKAKGIFGLISTHRDGFGVTVRSLAACGPDGKSAVTAGLKELEKYGYLVRDRVRNADGTLGEAEYFITDAPADDAPQADPGAPPAQEQQTPRSEPESDYPALDYPALDNRTHKKTKVLEDQLEEDQQAEAQTREAPVALGASSCVSGARDREEADAAGGVAAPAGRRRHGVKGGAARGGRPGDGAPLGFERVPESAVVAFLSAMPAELRAELPKRLPLNVYAAMAAALADDDSGRVRTVEQVARRIVSRWYIGGWVKAHDAGTIESHVAVLIDMLGHGPCGNPRCDGDDFDIDTQMSCPACVERKADKRADDAADGGAAPHMPRQSAYAPF